VLFPPTLTEFGAIAQRMIGMKPTIVVVHAGSGQNIALIRALRGVGYDGPILMGSHGLNETPLISALQGIGGLGRLQIVSRFASPDDPGKELDQLRAVAKKNGKRDPISTTSIMGWALGQVMEVALRKCGHPCSGEQLDGALQNLKVDMGSLMGGPIQFNPGDHYGTTWWRVYQYDEASKKFAPVSGWLEASSTPTLRRQ
jgi:branched-chain amino acid transport system substrate-binding protein